MNRCASTKWVAWLTAAILISACASGSPDGGASVADPSASAAAAAGACPCWTADDVAAAFKLDPTFACAGTSPDLTCRGAKGTTVFQLASSGTAAAVCVAIVDAKIVKLEIALPEAKACAALLAPDAPTACPCWTADEVAAIAAKDPKFACKPGTTPEATCAGAGGTLQIVPTSGGYVCVDLYDGTKAPASLDQASACYEALAPYFPSPLVDRDGDGVPDVLAEACGGATNACNVRCAKWVADSLVAKGLIANADRGRIMGSAHEIPGWSGKRPACSACHLKHLKRMH
jgi:hypothetical protein